MPNENDITVFKRHYEQLKAPCVIYADFECSTKRTGTVSTKEVKIDKYQHHRPCGFMINFVNSIDGSSKTLGKIVCMFSVKRLLKLKMKL